MKSLIRRIFLAVGLLVCMTSLQSCNYNSLVEKQQKVDQSWAAHESSTLEKVTQARAAATSINITADNLNEENLARFQQAQGELGQALKSLLAVQEAYPDLKANENFMALQAQLEGTENRITVARGRYTEAVQDYNTSIKKFPTVIYAGWFGFGAKPQFKAEQGAEKAPKVEF